ncbi:hypothetical protein TcBrA4_0043940 [Trypanosoma cruzi]|nr:hypothetical protein TcBrA4_0043940 [Trypanosoma cruzi]
MEQTGSSPAVLVADDFQTQVDVLYAQILASVDFSIDNNLESACGAKSVTQRPVRKRGASVACSAPVVKDVAVGEKVCCFCADDIVDVSTTTASTILMSDVNRVCGCSCHLPCAARGSHPEQQQQQQNSVNTSRECLGAMSRSVSSPQKTACGAYGRSKTGGLVLPRQRQPPSTFGSGRSGMCDSIKKTSAPGPGSYFRGDDEVMRYSVATRSHSKNPPVGGGGGAVGNCDPLGTRHARRSAEDAARALQRQFTLLCQCYWKQFPELGISTNAAAHARNCPCHSIHTASPGGTDSHSSSSRSSCNDASFRVGAKKTSGRRPVIPLTSSPFRVVSPSTKRGAVFGTSPCRAPPTEKQQQQQRSTHTESVENGPRKGRGPLVRDNTPSRGRPMELASTPGPGAYNVASAFDAASARGKTRSVSIGKAARRLHTPTESPGPGTYDTESKGQTGAQLKNNYFLTTSSRQLQWMAKHDGECSPGPGEYSTENATRTDARHKNSPAFSFGRAKLPVDAKRLVDASAMGKSDEVPGPGTYDVPMMLPDGATVIGGRSAVITTARRDDNMWRGVYYPPDDVPGPGHYVISKETTGPQWTFSTRGLPSVLEEPSPGPGDYSIPIFDVRRGLSATSFFPTAPRLLHEEANRAANLPGPGAYDVEDVAGVTRSAFIGTTQRFFKPESQEESVPGPGAYVVKHTARERRMAVPILASTAPRFYGCDSVDSRNLIPGPGHYDVVDNMRTLHERGAIIGTASRALTLDTAVATAATDAGPGAYDITLPKDGPSFSMRQRLMDRTVNGDPTPGPGKYDPRELSQGPSAVVGIAARFQSAEEEMLCNSVPGPGAYEAALPEKLSTTAFFGTSPRFVNNEVVMDEKMGGGLGPGVYDPREARSNIAGAAWGTSPRFFQEEYRDIPGPGAYEVASSSPMRGAVFGNADDKSDWIIPADAANLPGPGSYLPQDAPERMASAVVFGSSPKNALSPEEREAFMQRHIGPGSYDAVLQVPHAFHATFGGADTKRLGEGKPSDTTPGPGQYATTEESQAFVPRGVVFGTASRVPPLQDAAGTPGPGAYVPTLQPNDGSVTGPFSFPTAPRFHGGSEGFGDGNTYDTPGPGSYVLDNAGSQLGGRGAVVFGTEPRIPDYEQRERALFPGPGQYECVQDATTTNGPAYSFGKNPRISMHGNNDDGGFVGGGQAGDVPGPGSYDVVIPTLTAPTTRFGTSNRTVGPLLLSEVPGPGTYDVTKTTTVAAASAPAYRFSTAPRESHVDASDTPGPGQYGDSAADGSMWRRFTGASFPTESRFTTGKETDVILPGPGQYSPQHPQWNASQVYSFPSGKKEFFVGNDELPGPGTYNPTISPAGNGIRFGTAERGGEQSAQDGDVPGPGTYDVTLNRQEGSVFSMHRTAPRGPTLVEVEKSYIPGPGTYTLPPAFPATEGAGTGVSFLKAERFKTFDTVVDNVDCVGSLTAPGPGYYDPQLPQSTTGVFIARALRLVEVGDATAGVTDLPGPGHYEVRRGDPLLTTPLDGGVAMRFTAARFPLRDEATAAEMPGPASYSPVAPQNTTSGASFPHAPRFVLNETQERVEQPGPGEYSLPSAWCPSQDVGYSFGTSKKIEHVYATQDIPGPGSYDTNRYAIRYLTGPAFTVQGKSTYKDGHAGAEYPGPGAYSPQPVETARTTTFAPPSTVDPDAVFAARVNATPGPATYAIPATLSSQTVAFGTAPRTLEKTDDLPGPGAYLTSGPIVIPSQPAFSFGHAPRPDIVPQTQNNAPGPGEYHHPIDPGPPVPAFTFAGAERFVEAQAVSTTDPGQYYHPAPASQPRGPSFGFPTTVSTMTTAAAAAAAGVRAGTGSGLGPGVYFHPSHWDLRERGTSFPVTLGHYPPALGADTPGPGAYHVEPRQNAPLAAMTAQIGVLNTK